eukprot:TRINITY_DN11_c0_g1_i1.p1 TRINITY_DN11_c0_g1~~TRINITY_DN11_c0_g1_i1.p1  ORF type:complete len:118 (-),score=55.72 TRINITY_DN11_c0_g1_i1:65-418(-)
MPSDFHTEELAASYAALILHDANVPVKAESITSLCKAANVTIQPFWPKLFQQVFTSRSVGDFLVSSVGSGGAAPAAAAGGAPAAAASSSAPAKKEEPKKEEKKEESEEEDMGFGLFD